MRAFALRYGLPLLCGLLSGAVGLGAAWGQTSGQTLTPSSAKPSLNNQQVPFQQGTPVSPGLPLPPPEVTLPEPNLSPSTRPPTGLPAELVAPQRLMSRPSTPAMNAPAESLESVESELTAPEALPETTLDLGAPRLPAAEEASTLSTPVNSPIQLRGQLVKTQEIPIDLPTVLQLISTQSLPLERDTILAEQSGTRFYRTLSDMLPDVIGTYQQDRLDGVIQLFTNQTIPVRRVTYQPQVLARWPVFPGGTQVLQSVAAKRRQKRAQSLLAETTQEELARGAEEFYRLVSAQLQIASVLKSIEEAQSQVSYNEQRLAAGVGTRLEVMRARSVLVQQERALINTERLRATAEQNLLNRMNLDTDVHLLIEQNDIVLRRLVPPDVGVDTLIARAKAVHPILKSNELEIKALKAEFWSIVSQVVPSVRVEAYINGTGPSPSQLRKTTYAGLFVEANLLENLGTAIPLDAKLKNQEIQTRQAERRILERNIESDVVLAHLDAETAAKDIQVSEEEFRVAEETYRLATARYQAGLGINLDVIDAVATLIDSRTRLNASILSYNQAQVRLLEATGQINPATLVTGLSDTGAP